MSTKQVKVDNWGIFFLQRLKHFFNRTDYCDLTLHFHDNAQLKVHRLVLNACTEYFEWLERTCEMYEDCLIMPDDLQADVVVPIINFMYTGQLEYKPELLERLYQTASIMNMSVLTKLLDAQRKTKSELPIRQHPKIKNLNFEMGKQQSPTQPQQQQQQVLQKKIYIPSRKTGKILMGNFATPEKPKTPVIIESTLPAAPIKDCPVKSVNLPNPRINRTGPTRCELPEELDGDNIFEDSFQDISYGSQPLFSIKKEKIEDDKNDCMDLYNEPSTSQKRSNSFDTPTAKRPNMGYTQKDFNSILEDTVEEEVETMTTYEHVINSKGAKIIIEKSSKAKVDQQKVIQEVLKKYPDFVNSSKVIKLKILGDSTNSPPKKPAPVHNSTRKSVETAASNNQSWTYISDIPDTDTASKLIELGAQNTTGPWLCIICGTPGKAITFSTYYDFRKHLVLVHNEKPPSTICEYCGYKSRKRNSMIYHMLNTHNVPPPPSYRFPKCNECEYVALNENHLNKHKNTHKLEKKFKCNLCTAKLRSSKELLLHIQTSGHRYSNEGKQQPYKCVYCYKTFLREANLIIHLKRCHPGESLRDNILEEYDDESRAIKDTDQFDSDDETGNEQYEIQKLGPSFEITSIQPPKTFKKTQRKMINEETYYEQEDNVSDTEYQEATTVTTNQNTYLLNYEQFVLTQQKGKTYNQLQTTQLGTQLKGTIKKYNKTNQPIQIVVSNEQEYKALMSGNSSLIFEDNEQTAETIEQPQTFTEGTYIENVENQTVENSNIVVVYSQPGERTTILNTEYITTQSVPINTQIQTMNMSESETYIVTNANEQEFVEEEPQQPVEEVVQQPVGDAEPIADKEVNEETDTLPAVEVDKEQEAQPIEMQETADTNVVEITTATNDDTTNETVDNVESENNDSVDEIVQDEPEKATTEPEPVVEIANPKIQTLASEWSDDENPEKEKPDENEDSSQETTSEVEETIENIQNEINKHQDKDEEATPTTNGETPATEKVVINTLLKDWDDNESQDEDNQVNGRKNETDDTVSDAVEPENHEPEQISTV